MHRHKSKPRNRHKPRLWRWIFACALGAGLSARGQALPSAPQPGVQPPNGTLDLSLNDLPDARCDDLLKRSGQAIGREDFTVATTTAQQAVAACPGQSGPLLLLSRARMLTRQFDAAEQSLHKLLQSDPKDLPALILLGQVQYLSNHDADAAATFQQAIAIAPGKPEPRYWLGRLRYQDGQIQQAVPQFQVAIALDATYYKAYDGLGLCYEAMGQSGRSSESYLKAIELVHKDHPEYDVVYADFAQLLLTLDKNKQAFDLAAEAASRNPRSPRNFFLAGKALTQDGHDDVGLRWLTKATQMDPHYPDPHYLMARIYHKQGKLTEANAEVEAFKTLSAHAPQVRR